MPQISIIWEVPDDTVDEMRDICVDFVEEINSAHPECNAHYTIQGA